MFALLIYIIFVTVDFYLVVFWPTWHSKPWRRSTAVRKGGMIVLAGLELGFWILVNRQFINLVNWGFVMPLELAFIALLLFLIFFLMFAESRLRHHPHFQHLWDLELLKGEME
jgi:hypothetical protein